MKKRLFFVLCLAIFLMGVSLHGEVRSEPPGPARTVSENEKPSEWLDHNGHNKAWWTNQVTIWKGKREEALNALLQTEEAFNMTRFKNYFAVKKRIERNQLLEEIQKHTEVLRKAESMLRTTLPEQARRAGAPSGWLR